MYIMGSSVLSDLEKRDSHLYSLALMAQDTVEILGVGQGDENNKELHFVHGDFKVVRKILKVPGVYKASHHYLVFKGEDVVFDHPIIGCFNEFNHTNYESGGWEKELEQYSQAANIIPQANNVLRYLGIQYTLNGEFFEKFENVFFRGGYTFRIDGSFDKERNIKLLSVNDFTQKYNETLVFEYNPPNLPLHKRGDWENTLDNYNQIARKVAHRREQDIRVLLKNIGLEKILTDHLLSS